MLREIMDSPLLLGVGIAAAVAMGNYITSLFTRRTIAANLETLRLQAQITEFERSQALALEIAQAKAETARQQQALADALTKATAEKALVDATVAAKLDALAVVTEATHVQTNSARTAMERVEQELRSQLVAQALASQNAADAAALALQTAKDLAARDLAREREKNVRLTTQLGGGGTEPLPAADTPVPVTIIAEEPVPVKMVPHDEEPR